MTGKGRAILAMIVDGELKKLPTADLIAEIKRRRPCRTCFHKKHFGLDYCLLCVWDKKEDNYKPRSATDKGKE